ncbi:hypothetical protein ACOSP7_027130 [Xanthoceras sorbifolium]
MDKNRICKICNRRFANGKAMGGHMRSHLAKLPVPAKPDNQVESAPRFPSSSSSWSFHSTKYHMHTGNHRSMVSDMHDGESEIESPRNNPTRRRSERRRKTALVRRVVAPPPPPPTTMVLAEPDSVSSVSENFSDEELAMCLLMLSRDKWPNQGKQVVVESVEDEEEEVGKDDDEEEEDDEDDLFCLAGGDDHVFQTKEKKYKCEKCNKIFPSYQALGGHKASHKKIKICKGDGYVHFKPKNRNRFEEESTTSTVGGAGGGSSSNHKIPRIFKCPFCDKVFESGQALGGHKKVHFSYLSVNPKPPAKSTENLNIDLNLPAPEEESEVSKFSSISS